jgi:hypothetical protein
MKFQVYLASSWRNRHMAALAMRVIEADGHRITHDWTDSSGSLQTEKELARDALHDEVGVRQAQVYAMLWPGRLGSATELGIALALGKIIFIIGQVPKSVYVYANHPKVRIVNTLLEFLEALEVLSKRGLAQIVERDFAEVAMQEEDSSLNDVESQRELYNL